MPGKYNAKPCEYDGHKFPSQRERDRYIHLRLLERSGAIRNLELQPRFDIAINGKHCFFWKGDFSYFEAEKRVIEDAKGFRTPMYKLKRKCVIAAYNIDIREV